MMTEKRFYTDGQYVMQKGEVWVVAGGEHSADVIATALNELIEEINRLQFAYNMGILTRQSIEKENEQLKQAYQTLKHRHSLLHDECLEAECDKDSLKKDVISLEKENEQLKQSEKDCQEWNHKLINENEQLKQQLKEETDRIIKLEQYVYTKLCPKSEYYDEKVLSEIINTILGDVE